VKNLKKFLGGSGRGRIEEISLEKL